MSEHHGRFVWHDIMSTDTEGTKAFYTALFGWEAKEEDMGGGFMYTLFSVNGAPLGGTVDLGDAGIPSHWISYVGIDNLDAACVQATKAGGKVCIPAHPIGNFGRSAMLEDPTGGYFRLWEWVDDGSSHRDPEGPGSVCWNELMSSDPTAAAALYQSLLGWKTEEMEMGEMGTYHMFKAEGKDRGGMMNLPPNTAPRSHWLNYIMVEDVDAKVAEAKGLGAHEAVPPTDIPNIGRFAVLVDPQGAAFAVWQSLKTE